MKLRVGIIGCGTAGQAAAILLSRAGHEVTVFERSSTLSPVGAGILLQPTGMSVLAALGLLPEVLASGTRIRYLKGKTRRGRVILDLAYEDLRDGCFGLGVHRGTLFTTLQRAVIASGARVVCGTECTRVEDLGTGATIVGRSGEPVGTFDLAIIADGSRSVVRESIGPVRRARQYPWGALWLVAPDKDGGFGCTLAQTYHGTSSMVGFLPSGVGPEGHLTVSMFWSVRCDHVDQIRARGLDAWKSEVRALTPASEPILAHVHRVDDLIFASYQDVVMRRCHSARAVCIGDAAHAMSPQLGQGANLALMDAMVLHECLSEVKSVEAAMERFARTRSTNLKFYQRASRWLTPVFQSGLDAIGPPRDFLMPAIARIPWVRRQMLLSLAGVKEGLFESRPLPPPMVQ